MPMETDRRPDVMDCNADPSVKWMIKEYWKKYRDELVMQDRDSSDESLTQLLNIVNEEKLTDLKKTAHLCLNLRGVTSLPTTHCSTTTWKTGKLRSETNKRVFSVPVKWLIISPEEEEALDNLEEWQDDYRVKNDNHEAESCLENFVITEQPSNVQEIPTSSQTSQVSHVILRAEEDDGTQPDSSTPDILEDMEGNLPDDLDRSQSSLFSGNNEHVFEDNDAVVCENMTSIDSGITCGQKSHYVNDDAINQSQLSCSDTSIFLDMCYLDKESENNSFVSEKEKNTTPALCSVIVNDPRCNSDILRSEEDERINKKCFGQSVKQQAMKRIQPTEAATTFVEEASTAGRNVYAEKRPKMQGDCPLLESDNIVTTRAPLRKPQLQFLSVCNNRDAQEATETSNRALLKVITSTPVMKCQVKQNSTSTTKAQETLEDVPIQCSSNKMRHFDGSRLQYRYEAAGSALCTKVRSARLSDELLKWAFQVVFDSEQQEL